MNGALSKGMLIATALIRLDHHHLMSSVNQSAKTTSFEMKNQAKTQKALWNKFVVSLRVKAELCGDEPGGSW